MYPTFYHLDKLQILAKTEEVVRELVRTFQAIREEEFYSSRNKRSAFDHLLQIEAAFQEAWSKLFTLKFILSWKYGKPRHDSFSFEQMEETFLHIDMDEMINRLNKLSLKKKNSQKSGLITERLEQFNMFTERYLNEIRFYWEDDQMDRYQLPHEQIGLITAREWMYSIIIFCWMELNKIRKRKEDTRIPS